MDMNMNILTHKTATSTIIQQYNNNILIATTKNYLSYLHSKAIGVVSMASFINNSLDR